MKSRSDAPIIDAERRGTVLADTDLAARWRSSGKKLAAFAKEHREEIEERIKTKGIKK